MSEPLILTGALELAAGDGVTTGFTDVSDHCTAFELMRELSQIEVKATLASPRQSRPGSVKNSIRIAFYPNVDATGVWSILNAALDSTTTARGYVTFRAQLVDGAITSTNPRYSGTAVVSGVKIGGNAFELSEDDRVFPLKSGYTTATS